MEDLSPVATAGFIQQCYFAALLPRERLSSFERKGPSQEHG
jgi:hypothetical protein